MNIFKHLSENPSCLRASPGRGSVTAVLSTGQRPAWLLQLTRLLWEASLLSRTPSLVDPVPGLESAPCKVPVILLEATGVQQLHL